MRLPATTILLSVALPAQGWLGAHQHEDGHWGGPRCPPTCKRVACDGRSAAGSEVALTSLVLLCHLGDGSTLRSGPHADRVRRAAGWLEGRVDERGRFVLASGNVDLHGQALGTWALVEAFGLSKANALRAVAQRAVSHLASPPILERLWGQRERQRDDPARAWTVRALQAARDFHLDIGPADAKVQAWLGDQRIRHGSPAFHTALVLTARIFVGQRPDSHPVMSDEAESLLAHPPAWRPGDPDLEYWVLGTSVIFQMGGRYWKTWRKTLGPSLVKTQHLKAPLEGSWDPVGRHATRMGRVHSTALGVLCLEVYYRYDRLTR